MIEVKKTNSDLKRCNRSDIHTRGKRAVRRGRSSECIMAIAGHSIMVARSNRAFSCQLQVIDRSPDKYSR